MFAVLNEVKRIINLKSIMIVIFICVITSSFYSKIYKETYEKRYEDINIKVASMLLNNYGEYLEEEELKEFNNILESKLKETEKFVQENEKNKDITICLEKEGKGSIYFQINGKDDLDNKEIYVLNEKYEKEIEELLAMNQCRLLYNNEIENLDNYWQSDNDYRRVRENGEWKSIFPGDIMEYYDYHIESLAYVLIITIIIFSSTLFLSDKKEGVYKIQYVSKVGVNIYNVKVKATIIAASILFIIESLIMFILFLEEQSIEFLNININSFLNGIYNIDLTYLQYIIFSLFIIYVIGICTTLITVFFASEANNYTEIIVMQVTFIFIMIGILCPLILKNFMHIKNIGILMGFLVISILVNRKGYIYLVDRLEECL